ncbi:MAG: type II toxin-antitoxin system RelE/ParE family toxin [Betaproteobacteria bacterium]
MKYTVVWSPDAERELARVWNEATDRESIANAANLLDHELARDPLNSGESRPGGFCIAHCLPLGIRFSVLPEDQLVRVLAVWECRRK